MVRAKKLLVRRAPLQLSTRFPAFRTLTNAKIVQLEKLQQKVQVFVPNAKLENSFTKTKNARCAVKGAFQLEELKMNVNFVQEGGLQTKDERLVRCARLENMETTSLALTTKRCAFLVPKEDSATLQVLNATISAQLVPEEQLF